jgi:Flp pilus assembly protein TadB
MTTINRYQEMAMRETQWAAAMPDAVKALRANVEHGDPLPDACACCCNDFGVPYERLFDAYMESYP